MAVQLIGAAGNVALVDASGNLIVREGRAAVPAAGGFYTVAGGPGAVVAAALAANTMLMSMRLALASGRAAYITRLLLTGSIATLGAAAGVAGTLGLQRFTAQTPTGGTARTAARMDAVAGTASDITDIRDSNAALTGSAPTFGDVLARFTIPLTVTSGQLGFSYVFEPKRPIKLIAGDGLALRTQVQMAATQTWLYDYTFDWYEE